MSSVLGALLRTECYHVPRDTKSSRRMPGGQFEHVVVVRASALLMKLNHLSKGLRISKMPCPQNDEEDEPVLLARWLHRPRRPAPYPLRASLCAQSFSSMGNENSIRTAVAEEVSTSGFSA